MKENTSGQSILQAVPWPGPGAVPLTKKPPFCASTITRPSLPHRDVALGARGAELQPRRFLQQERFPSGQPLLLRGDLLELPLDLRQQE